MAQETSQTEKNIGTVMTSVVKYVGGQAASVETAVFEQEHSRQRMPLPEDFEAKRNHEDLPKPLLQITRIFQDMFGSYMRYKFLAKAEKSEALLGFLAQWEVIPRQNGTTAEKR